ncbi:hypothetical protein Nepgr_015620 [Nepenthes gracilis]|uniref:DNA-directed RNA polymerase n=1 Tax=Nepenthes gracilis TaxID=150966 RepID=A0AAD3SN92_NEPGR|nr:hypothetical protein Nepgr_015620 [Nepenthes gracilis]
MAATTSFYPNPQVLIENSLRKHPKPYTNSNKNETHFPLFLSQHKNHLCTTKLSKSSLLSASFPSIISLPSFNSKFRSNGSCFSSPLPQTISDSSVKESVIERLNKEMNLEELKSEIQLNNKVSVQDPHWINALFMRGLFERSRGMKLEFKKMERQKYNLLRRRQIRAETEAWENMVEEYRQLQREMCERKLAPNLPQAKALFLGWFEPLKKAIEKEQTLLRSKKQQVAYAPHIDLLPADKMAVIVMHKMMGLLMVENEGGSVRVVQAAVQVGSAVEQEIQIHSFLERTKNARRNDNNNMSDGLIKEKELLRKRVNSLIRRRRLFKVSKLVRTEETVSWGRDTQAKLGSRLIELLIETAYVQHPVNQSADSPPDIRPAFRHKFKIGTKGPGQQVAKRYGVIECDPLVLKGIDKSAKHMVIPYVPMLVPPRSWKGYDNGGYFFLPSNVMRTHGSRKQQDAIKQTPSKQMQRVFEALDTLGNTKWRVNKRVLSVVEILWARGGNIAGLVDCEDIPLPEKPFLEDSIEIDAWKWSARKAKKINRERHALRCDIELKLSVARKMRDEEGFYYPHNLDFRGRAYPMHPHLNHLSSDLCRGLLEFAEGRPLGTSGLHWLKIHLANLYAGGIDKLSYEGRLAFVENHLEEIFDSANNPLNGNRWWLTAEDPFQCLAACMNLSEALNSSLPHTVISHLPIHQDGSCNGLQHYAALGRDTKEAAAVNLVAGQKPADVYSEIAARVLDIMERDSRKDPGTNPDALLAKILVGQVDRKLVKQTVMTSVYGVTFVGAREQIKRRLEEKGHITDDRLLFGAACYSAKVTLSALGEIFEAARNIMDWLGDCAKVIASENQPVRWTTPLGLPVVQPYCNSKRHLIKTSLQVLALQREGDMIETKKQRTAFPPNFVHSLDGSHMMMTAVACREAGLQFAGVHDSFWTHACDVDQMNQILRKKFVELYSTPILENLLESFKTSYPALAFPPLPERGNFNLEEVLESPYFFN